MKTKRILMHTLIWLLLLLTLSPLLVFAQDQPTSRRFMQEELDQMLAPIALYPDSLLAQVLMAATYPLEVVQADRWAKINRNLTGDQLNDALDNKNWDPSVKALVPFPQVLAMMSERLEWTQKLGDAFLDQEDEVMGTVQELRAKAEAAGNLKDTLKDRDGDKLLEYAQRFISSEGKKNGLYWEVKEGEKPSPLGPLVAKAAKEGYIGRRPVGKHTPYHGYYYKTLKAQGKNAAGGEYDYIVKDKMIGGFALVAYPAEYGNSGVMTFIVNHDGVVYEKDLGKDTEKIATAIKKFDPDKTWKKAE